MLGWSSRDQIRISLASAYEIRVKGSQRLGVTISSPPQLGGAGDRLQQAEVSSRRSSWVGDGCDETILAAHLRNRL